MLYLSYYMKDIISKHIRWANDLEISNISNNMADDFVFRWTSMINDVLEISKTNHLNLNMLALPYTTPRRISRIEKFKSKWEYPTETCKAMYECLQNYICHGCYFQLPGFKIYRDYETGKFEICKDNL